ncbi:MAG: TrmH family RNA methyltransferase [Patescibacteria group bacterium]
MQALLHNIRSMHNVGSIFRTADAAGVEKLYLCGITPGPFERFHRPNTPLLKVSLGAERTVAWERAASTSRLVNALHKDGYRIFALEQHSASVNYRTVKLTEPQWRKAALILGDEVHGIPFFLLKKADQVLEIPMHGKKESLNVSVAFGIVVFHLLPHMK